MIKLPALLPDELLFSRLLRYRLLYGLGQRQLHMMLYGNKRISCHPSLPPVRANFMPSASYVEDIINKQTMAPIFQMGLPKQSQSIKHRMVSNKSNLIGRIYQLPNNKGRQTLVLHSCDDCISDDLIRFGIAYWHRAHQISNVTACYRHKKILSATYFSERCSLSVTLPSITLDNSPPNTIDCLYAEFCWALLNTSLSLTKEQSVSVITKKLDEAGFLTCNRQVRRQALCESLFLITSRLNISHTYFAPAHAHDYRYIQNILNPKQYTHPGRLCIFLFWLSCQKIAAQKSVSLTASTQKSREKLEQRCLGLLMEGESFNRTSALIGKSRTYVKSIALKNGLTQRLNPKTIDSRMRQHILSLASSGRHRSSIAAKFGISSGSVELIIASKPDIVLKRKRIKFESMRRRYRVAILRYRQKNKRAKRKDVFKDCNKAAHWLFANDHDWLQVNMPSALMPSFR